MSNTEHLREILVDAQTQLQLSISESQVEQLLRYVVELEKWNKTYNLTAIRDIESMLKRHVVDALSVVQSVSGYAPRALADIGTGGGIPGVVLAIMFPEMNVYLVESIGKKCRFLRHVVTVLGLADRVTVMQQRVEAWQPDEHLDVIICRAFTSLDNFTTITAHLGDGETTWLAMKSDKTDAEMTAVSAPFTFVSDAVLHVPFEEAERHLLVFKKQPE